MEELVTSVALCGLYGLAEGDDSWDLKLLPLILSVSLLPTACTQALRGCTPPLFSGKQVHIYSDETYSYISLLLSCRNKSPLAFYTVLHDMQGKIIGLKLAIYLQYTCMCFLRNGFIWYINLFRNMYNFANWLMCLHRARVEDGILILTTCNS